MPAKLSQRTEAVLKSAWGRIVAGEADRGDFRRVFLTWGRLSMYNRIVLMGALRFQYPQTWALVNDLITDDTERVLI